MKKIAGILLLAAVILTAGCVTTADPIVGSWQTAEPIQYEDFSTSYLITFEEDGTGEVIYSYSDEVNDYTYPILWEKTDGIYQYEALTVFTFSEDGKTMTDNAQYSYSLAEGEEKFGGVWTEIVPGGAEVDYHYTYVFNEDGTGVETIYETGDESEVYSFTWEEFGENQIQISYLETYSFTEDGKMTTSLGTKTVYEKQDNIWVENPQIGDEVTTYEFQDDGICVRSIYDGETKKLVGVHTYYYTPVVINGDSIRTMPLLTPMVSLFNLQIGGILEEAYIYELAFLEDGTLQDVFYGEILERVSPA